MTLEAINAINQFKAGVKGAFKKHIDTPDKLDPSNPSIFQDAVNAAYGDAKRTFKGINGRATQANKNLASKIQTYFQNSAPNNSTCFDDLHNKWCDAYISDLNNKGYTTTTYGQSQKVVNMTFKYLYCLDDATTYDNHFKYCHVALDSYTLEWIWRNCDLAKTESHDDWSKIQYDDRSTKKKNIVGYEEIKKRYRNNKPINYPDTPFQSEFIFWPEIQMHLACEAFYFALDDTLSKADKEKFKNEKDLNLKKAKIKKHLKTN